LKNYSNTPDPKVSGRSKQKEISEVSMRIAWLGEVSLHGGVGNIGTLLLDGILRQGVEVDYYCVFQQPPEELLQHPNLTVISQPSSWEWNRWYSCTPLLAYLTGTILARARSLNKLSETVIRRHATQPYDCIFQHSQAELFKLGANLDRLPPIVVYPCVHAAGEMRWHRRESAYALQSENFWMHYLIRLVLTLRTWVQQRELRKPSLILGMSQRFNTLLAADYNISPERQGVLYNAIQQQSEAAIQTANTTASQRTLIKLLFVARISVRKGLQYIIELSHRLDDLAGQIQIEVIGDRTQWSDYRAHLKELNPNTAEYLGPIKNSDVLKLYDTADILLLPSLYEPGGIVVGEALSHGLCVVTSDAVGSAEVLEGQCYREFPAGDMDQFELQVRQLIQHLRAHRQELRQQAREQCQKHFAPEKIAEDLLRHLKSISAKELLDESKESAHHATNHPVTST
jgi:glycosyltransferase involved in cell wall biosynthesis